MVALISIYRYCGGHRIYLAFAWGFILIRLAVVGYIAYESVALKSIADESFHLGRLRLYAIALGMIEVLIVMLQIGNIRKLRRKLYLATKEPE